MDDRNIDEVLGITRCARCGHRLEGEVECPFCSMFPDREVKRPMPLWIYVTACFLTSPLSLYWIIRSRRLGIAGKLLTASGALVWAAVLFIMLF